jgi:hypothetical protein
MSSPLESEFVKDSFAELTEIEKSKLDADEKVKKLLQSQESQIGTITYGGVEIRFRLFLSKSLRHKMMKGQKQLEGAKDEEALSRSERTMYDILGQLCIDEPWNEWETWAYVDEKSENVGGVQSIFLQVLARIAQAVEDVKNFRPR